MSQWGSGASRAVAATVGTCLLVTLVGWAALIGPSQVFSGPGPTCTSDATITPSEEPADMVDFKELAQRRHGENTTMVADAVAIVILLAALAGVLLAAFLLLRRAWEAWQLRRRYDAPASADFDVLEAGDPERVRRTMADDADAQLGLLLDGEPRNAIVATWHRFEVQAEQSGLRRHAWETSSEFAGRMLDVAEVDSAAVTRLLELYREARFSEHELDESHRQAAGEALRKIQSQIGPHRSRMRS